MKILVFIDNDLYFRNFVLSGSLDEINKTHNLTLCLSDAVTKFSKKDASSFKVTKYKRDELNKQKASVFNQISMRHFKDKSSTFAIKVSKYHPDVKSRFLFWLLSHSPLFNITRAILSKQTRINQHNEQLVKKLKPDLVIFPFSGYEGTGNELILLSKKYQFKTLFLTNGWDNLSSKGIILFKPDFMGLWGPQALEDALNIQGMQIDQCFLIGCSRFENYFSKKTKLKKIFPFKYILFAGSTTATDEIEPLRQLDKIISKNNLKDIKVVYRPHPMRAPRKGDDYFDQKEFKHIIIDPQIAGMYYHDKRQGTESGAAQNFPELSYNPSLLSKAEFIITPLSSIMLEAAIFGVPSLVLAHPDDLNPIPASLQAKWRHFEGARNIPGWFFVDQLTDLEKIFMKMIREKHKDNRRLIKSIRRYLYFDDKLYKDRLLEKTNTIKH